MTSATPEAAGPAEVAQAIEVLRAQITGLTAGGGASAAPLLDALTALAGWTLDQPALDTLVTRILGGQPPGPVTRVTVAVTRNYQVTVPSAAFTAAWQAEHTGTPSAVTDLNRDDPLGELILPLFPWSVIDGADQIEITGFTSREDPTVHA